jgi:tetratricopeptide (TPR) repeat protein
MLSMAQFHLLKRNVAEADKWTARLKESGASAQKLIQVAKLYESARLPDQAAALYGQALSTDHYPEAHLGLARVETERNNKVEARNHILAALNVDRPVGKEGATAWQIFHPIVTQMLWLQQPIVSCQAWMVAFPGNSQPAALAGQTLMVYAGDQQQAQEHLRTVLNALQPDKPPVALNANHWKLAPRPMQPDGPVRPGVQGFWK